MPVFSSTAIRRAEYDRDTRVLRVWFADSGNQYDYSDVPQYVFDGLCRAASKGSYFNDHIRDHYRVVR
jgi:hypothetical protein